MACARCTWYQTYGLQDQPNQMLCINHQVTMLDLSELTVIRCFLASTRTSGFRSASILYQIISAAFQELCKHITFVINFLAKETIKPKMFFLRWLKFLRLFHSGGHKITDMHFQSRIYHKTLFEPAASSHTAWLTITMLDTNNLIRATLIKRIY